MKILLAIALCLLITSCTDAGWAGMTSLGSAGHITCYSGDIKTYEGDSTGKILTVQQSDGWEFKDAKTGKFVRVSGACVIVN